MVCQNSPQMGSNTRGSFGDGDQTDMSPDQIIQFTRSPRKPPEFKPRSHSPTRLPGGLRVPVIQKPTPRLRPRLEESLAGLAELKVLKEKQQKRILDAKLTTTDHGQTLDFLHLRDTGQTVQWHSPGSLSSISEEDLSIKQNMKEPGSENVDISFNWTENGSSPSRHSYASNNSLDSVGSDVSTDEQKLEKSLNDAGVGRKLSSLRGYQGYQSVDLQMTFPGPQYFGQRRASVQCMPQSTPVDFTSSANKSHYRERRASFQCEAVLTKSANRETNSKIISDMKLNYNFPGPVHAVMRQYGSSSNLLTNTSSPRQSSASLNTVKADTKNPMDVLRAWQLEKRKGNGNNKLSCLSPDTAQGVRNGVGQGNEIQKDEKNIQSKTVDKCQPENNNDDQVRFVSLSDECVLENKENNCIQGEHLQTTSTVLHRNRNSEEKSGNSELSGIKGSKKLSESTTNIDHIREQSFTSDYYGSVETVHSIQSLPVSRASFRCKQSSEGLSSGDQHLFGMRRHSLPCTSSTQLLPTPSGTRSYVSNQHRDAKVRDHQSIPKHSCAHKTSSSNSSYQNSSGNLSCGEDEVFANSKPTTSFSAPHNQTALSSADKSCDYSNLVLKESMSHKRPQEDVPIPSSTPSVYKPVPDIRIVKNTHARVTRAIPDEGYVESVLSREGSFDDLTVKQLPEAEKITDGNEKRVSETESKSSDKKQPDIVRKTLLETSL